MPRAPGYPARFESARILPSENVVELALAKQFRIQIEAYGGHERIPALYVDALATEIGGAGTTVTHSFDDRCSYLEVDRPGSYSVELFDVAGYERPSAVVITVGPGITTPTAVFRLVPAAK
jgi:hypothetical protein